MPTVVKGRGKRKKLTKEQAREVCIKRICDIWKSEFGSKSRDISEKSKIPSGRRGFMIIATFVMELGLAVSVKFPFDLTIGELADKAVDEMYDGGNYFVKRVPFVHKEV